MAQAGTISTAPAATTSATVRPVEGRRAAAVTRQAAATRTGAMLQVAAALLWVPQAGLLAMAVGTIVAGEGAGSVLGHAAGVLAIGIARALLDALGSRVAFRQARAVLTRWRAEAVAALAARSPVDIERPAAGLAASTLAEQAEAVVPYLARFQPARLRASIVPLVILLVVFASSWAAALVLLVAAPLIPVFMALVGWRAKAASEAQLVELGSMNAFLLDRLRGLATIRSLDAVDVTARRLRADAESLRARTMAVLRIAFLSSAVLELFSALGVALVAVYIGFHLLGQLPFGTWGGPLTLAEGLFILLLAPAFFEPLRDLSAVWHDRAAGEAALEALVGLSRKGCELPGAEDEDPAPALVTAEAPSVRIEKLRFSHPGRGEPVFDDFNLTVAPGERVALLAPSGGGKSTLLALLAGLVTPESGRIIIAGEPLTARSAARLRRGIALIGQRPHVFAGSLAANVRLGREGIGRAAVEAALASAGLAEVARRRGAVPVGENGVGLSGGEASRLALARIAVAPQTRLILADEPTAHLDSETAASITEALMRLSEGRTLIVATHDPVLAGRMDRVIDLAATRLEDAA